MLVKILLLGVAVWLVLSLLKQYRRSLDAPQTPQPPSQDMVRCATCDVHLPKAESIEKDGKYYCSIEHSQQHRS